MNLITTNFYFKSGFSKQGGFEIHIDNIEAGLNLYDYFFKIGNEFNLKPGAPNHQKELKEAYCHMEMIWISGIILLNVDSTNILI